MGTLTVETCCPWRLVPTVELPGAPPGETWLEPTATTWSTQPVYLRCINSDEFDTRAGLPADDPLYLPEPSGGLLVGLLLVLVLARRRRRS